jgi:signal transduction histidine kinase
VKARELTPEPGSEAAQVAAVAAKASAANDCAAPAAPLRMSKAMEDEVYSVLGALLGMLEVLSIDTQAPLTERQRRFVNDALRFGDMLRARVEALVTLFSDERDERYQPAPYALRRLIDHSVRAASWAAAEKGVSIVLPPGDSAGTFLLVDASRVDRALRSITDTLVSALGKDGQVLLRVEERAESVLLALSAGPVAPASSPALALSSIMLSAWSHLFRLQGGSMRVDAAALSVSIELPKVVREGAP